jgi:hypothetical protein
LLPAEPVEEDELDEDVSFVDDDPAAFAGDEESEDAAAFAGSFAGSFDDPERLSVR